MKNIVGKKVQDSKFKLKNGPRRVEPCQRTLKDLFKATQLEERKDFAKSKFIRQ